MAVRVLFFALSCFFALAGVAFAGDPLTLEATPVTGFFDGKKNAFCIELAEESGQTRYLACDDATSKDIMERLFELGKKNASCRLECESAGSDGEYSLVVVKKIAD